MEISEIDQNVNVKSKRPSGKLSQFVSNLVTVLIDLKQSSRFEL